jgi:hypothetical protein
MGASLAGGFVENGMVTCAWHYWRFRLVDGAWADNPRIKIGCYPVHVEGDEIRLELPDPPPGIHILGGLRDWHFWLELVFAPPIAVAALGLVAFCRLPQIKLGHYPLITSS